MKQYDGAERNAAPRRYSLEEERKANVIGKRIKAARKANKYSLEDFRKLLERNGVSVSRYAVNKWEQGETVPSAYQLVAIFHALGQEEQVCFLMRDYQPPLNDEGIKKVQIYKEDLIATGKYAPTVSVEDNAICNDVKRIYQDIGL